MVEGSGGARSGAGENKRGRALGAVLGALAGDAAGAVLEFFGSTAITERDVLHALSLPGGGTWRVAPGQVTDDGELTMSLLHALCDGGDPTEASARRYAAWVASDPFDIGATTAASLGCLRRQDHAAKAAEDGCASVMQAVALERCSGSKANGSLMRATPLAVFGATRALDTTIAVTRSDALLSHPNPACVGAVVAYVAAIRHLILNEGDVAGAFAAAEAAVTDDEPRAWLAEARAGMHVPYTPLEGFVRIGFTHAFRQLLAGTPYRDAIAETLLGGGDTDTNACIVGGLLGARFGVAAIPEEMRRGVLDANLEDGANPRPDALHPRHAPALVAQLLG